MDAATRHGERSGERRWAALRFTPGLVSGVGLGAMVDGLLFHELLQWHHFLSSTEGFEVGSREPASHGNLEANLTADGLFHAFAVTVTIIGFVLLWRWGRRHAVADARTTIGSVIVGAAAFNIVDVVLLHFVLGLHHLHEETFELGSDLTYLALNLVLGALGIALAGRSRRRTHSG